jgi:hypothetical protein
MAGGGEAGRRAAPGVSQVFIVLAAREPHPALLERQLASLSAQTLRDWTGVVVDDASSEATCQLIRERAAREPRLRLIQHADHVGYYRNFERGLAMVPATCRYVALCDQDDYWAPEKLAWQVAALKARPEARLCYTDLRLVDPGGKVLAESFWELRPHGRSFREALYNNVVTGTTGLFCRELLDVALPFPDDPGGAFHDHWLALCSMASGGLMYLDEPLVDYTQHAGSVIGAQGLEHAGRGAVARLLGEPLRQTVLNPKELARRLDELAAHAVRAEARLRSFATALRARVTGPPPEASKALRPFLRRHRGIRVLDLAFLTLLGSLAAKEETNLEPLKIAVGLAWHAFHR